MNEFLVGVYKEVGKQPDIVKIKNDKAYLEKLLDGEYVEQDYDDYIILYKKDSERLLPNIYINQYSKLGISLKGKVFAVSKDENGNLKSLNKDQAKRCLTFFLRESFNYKNFDEYGRYIPRSKRKGNKKIFNNKKENTEQEKTPETKQQEVSQNKQSTSISHDDMKKALNVGNQFFESQFRLEKVESKKQDENTSNSNENAKIDTNKQNSTNSQSPIIQLSDEQTLTMILKITFIILDFVKGALEDSEDED